MKFNEKTHAFLVARFYVHLTTQYGDQGKQAFIHAVQYYAGQRGRRMAQRAIRDGQPLNHAAYLQYGELILSEDADPARTECVSLNPDYEIHIHHCLWHDQFREMDCLEAGKLYCSYIDEALCRGFNPALEFHVLSNLNCAPYCIHQVSNTNYRESPHVSPETEYKRDFCYHCGHLFWSFHEVCKAIFESDSIPRQVMEDFSNSYGTEMAQLLAAWQGTNFNIC